MPKVLIPLLRHRRHVDRLLFIFGLASTACVILGGMLLYRDDWPQQRFLFFYIAPLFAYGAAWARDRLARIVDDAGRVVAIDALAFVTGALRISGGWGVLPYSGHMLFLTYAALSPGTRVLRWLALFLLCVTTAFKLLLWHDPLSWSLGLLIGALLGGARMLSARMTATSPTEAGRRQR